ncbi:MAG: DUF5615 family PIN-like protein [Actinomycetota bacterium]|nr:DUF5615 family PIN-like protein [Actinomycetota bacterium]
MRLFLDAHISGRRVARALRDYGHDVRAADEERDLDGMGDEQLLALAAGEQRIFVTFDVADFSRIVQAWAAEGRSHAGCAIVVGVDHSEFGTIIAVVLRALAGRPTAADWCDYTWFVTRSG